jgi:ribosomal protein S12 methylthiotransferase
MQTQTSKIGFVSLGCPKALVDSERIITQLRAEGYTLVPQFAEADLVIVNTCGFINEAVEESLQSISDALDQNGKVIVTGCLGAKPDVILNKFPQVLEVTGPQAYETVMSSVHKHLPPQHHPFESLMPPQGVKLTPKHYAYVKISEGCNHSCSFCIIPSMRGKLVSRPIGEIMKEASHLAAAGVKELLIISQDTSAYGVDLKYKTDLWQGRILKSKFYDLTKALGELNLWVRLHYVYPYPHVDEIIPLMAEGKILPYLDIPFQHASPKILKAMKRPASSENNLKRICAWRNICPTLTIRSTFIVGFPGETEEDFEQLLAFLEEAQIDRAGCFQYSPVEGAHANALPDAVPAEIKQVRYDRFMQLQAKISQNKLRQKIGKTLPVLVDTLEGEYAIGRSESDAPEIDGLVYIETNQKLSIGDKVNVNITAAKEYDLWGTLCQS